MNVDASAFAAKKHSGRSLRTRRNSDTVGTRPVNVSFWPPRPVTETKTERTACQKANSGQTPNHRQTIVGARIRVSLLD